MCIVLGLVHAEGMFDLSVAGKVASITLQNHQKRNALSHDMLHALHEALQGLDETMAFLSPAGAR